MKNRRREGHVVGDTSHHQSVHRTPTAMISIFIILPVLALASEPAKLGLIVDEYDGNFFGPTSLPHERTDKDLCVTGTVCIAISNCLFIQELMGQNCLASEKLGALTCGYRGNEVMICCPQGVSQSPFISHHNETDSPLSEEVTCGQPMFNDKRKQKGPGGLGSQPWVVRVGYININSGQMTYPCCGSIISQRTILTAAHCAIAKATGYKLATVRIGEYDSKGDPDCTKTFCAHPAQDVSISHVIVHPGFDSKIFKHDVAMIILKEAINYSVAALPICLLGNSKIPLVGRRGMLVGWGKFPGQEVTPSREQLLELPIVPLEKCTKVYSRSIPVTENQMCAGGEEGRDACSGFGGAPLILLDHFSKSRYYQVGIASFGSDRCGTAGVPSVYTNVHRYAEWIWNNMD